MTTWNERGSGTTTIRICDCRDYSARFIEKIINQDFVYFYFFSFDCNYVSITLDYFAYRCYSAVYRNFASCNHFLGVTTRGYSSVCKIFVNTHFHMIYSIFYEVHNDDTKKESRDHGEGSLGGGFFFELRNQISSGDIDKATGCDWDQI